MSEPYVTFNGVSSATISGLIVEQLPAWKRARRQYTAENVSGRDGRVYMKDMPYDVYSASVRVNVPADKVDDANAFFSGDGWMISSHDPTEKVYVRFLAESQPTRYPAGDVSITYAMDCDPIRRITPDAADIVKTSSGSTFVNPGTYWSQPKIYINGSGAFSVTISNGTHSSTMFFTGVPSTGIRVDSELMDAFNWSESGIINHCISDASDDFFRIYPGMNTVTWATGGEDETGSVTSVTITPRWRNI